MARRLGLAEQPALHHFAALFAQLGELRFMLHALGQRAHAQPVGEADHRRHNRARFLAAFEIIHKAAINLDLVEREGEQIVERGIARSKIIQRNLHAQRMQGIQRGDVAPPSAILQGATFPGSCWPMAGRSGRVTLQLPYPVKVSAVSIDHISPLLVTEETSRRSAPKTLRVYGYPACESYCNGLGFDVKRKVVLAEFEYDAQVGGVQTFAVASHAPAGPSSTCDDAPAAIEDAADASSGSCSAPHPKLVEPILGMELAVLENMGNSDYTCLYRFRVHGEAVDTR